MFSNNSKKKPSFSFLNLIKNLFINPVKLSTLSLAILLLPVNLTISGLIFIFIILNTLVSKSSKSIKDLYNHSLNDKYLNISFLSLITFFGWSFIQGLFSLDKLAHYAGLIGHYLIYLLLFIVLIKLLGSFEKIQYLFSSIVLSGFIASVIGILSFFRLIKSFKLFYIPIYGGDYLLNFDLGNFAGRASSFAMNPNILGCYLLITIFVSIFLVYQTTSNNITGFNKYIYYEITINKFKLKVLEILILVQCLSLILTGSRGAIISLCFGVLLILIFQTKSLKAFTLLVSISFIVIYPLSNTSRISSSIDLSYSSNQKRIEVWQDSIEIIKDFPFGVGILNFEKIYPNYLKPGKTYIPHAHNWILQTCIESGVPATIIFFISYFSLLLFFIRKLTKKESVITIIFICFFIFNLTDYVLTDTRICILMTLVISIALIIATYSKSRTMNF